MVAVAVGALAVVSSVSMGWVLGGVLVMRGAWVEVLFWSSVLVSSWCLGAVFVSAMSSVSSLVADTSMVHSFSAVEECGTIVVAAGVSSVSWVVVLSVLCTGPGVSLIWPGYLSSAMISMAGLGPVSVATVSFADNSRSPVLVLSVGGPSSGTG